MKPKASAAVRFWPDAGGSLHAPHFRSGAKAAGSLNRRTAWA